MDRLDPYQGAGALRSVYLYTRSYGETPMKTFQTAARSTQDTPCPHKLGDQTEHFWLIQRMAKTSGVDLAAAMQAGKLDHKGWSGMVTRCRGCAWAEGCHAWLDKVDQAADLPPKPCLNRDRMAELKTEAV